MIGSEGETHRVRGESERQITRRQRMTEVWNRGKGQVRKRKNDSEGKMGE